MVDDYRWYGAEEMAAVATYQHWMMTLVYVFVIMAIVEENCVGGTSKWGVGVAGRRMWWRSYGWLRSIGVEKKRISCFYFCLGCLHSDRPSRDCRRRRQELIAHCCLREDEDNEPGLATDARISCGSCSECGDR
jgi:hypothetical protein